MSLKQQLAEMNNEWNEFFVDDDHVKPKIDFYDKYAKAYDQGMSDDQYRGPSMMAQLVFEFFHEKPDASIIFLPAGTGKEIEELQKLGNGCFTNITGLDGSKNMLEILGQKALCKDLVCKFFKANCGMPADTYDAIACVGGFVPSHLQIDALEEMCRITKPGGLIMIMLREAYLYDSKDYNDGKFFNEIQRITTAGLWEKVCVKKVAGYYGELPGMKFIFKKL